MNVLLTGGMGFIGSHTAVCLLNAGHRVVIYDNLYNSKTEVINRIKEITGKNPVFYEGNILNANLLKEVILKENINSVIHFAGLKAVGESVAKPLFYYENNVAGTINLCKIMSETKVRNLVFSSSATVYGDSKRIFQLVEQLTRTALLNI